jgi:hypothetical protein
MNHFSTCLTITHDFEPGTPEHVAVRAIIENFYARLGRLNLTLMVECFVNHERVSLEINGRTLEEV